MLVILTLVRSHGLAGVAPAVGAYIGSAYFFRASTSFANPAITVGHMFSDTFAGIAPASASGFIAAQLVGAALAVGLAVLLYPREVTVGPDPASGSLREPRTTAAAELSIAAQV